MVPAGAVTVCRGGLRRLVRRGRGGGAVGDGVGGGDLEEIEELEE